MSDSNNLFPEGFNRSEYAALELCRKYIEKTHKLSCVHCKFFAPSEPATVIAPMEHTSADQSQATISGDCFRFPPSICVRKGIVDYSARPVVEGDDFCGEFVEAQRSAEEIFYLGFWEQ